MIPPIKKKVQEYIDLIRGIGIKGSFIQNFAITFSGTALTIVGQLIFTPIVTRIYGPEAYGVFGLFNAIVMNIGMLATLMYEQALLIPKKEDDFKSLLQLTLWLATISSLVVLIVTMLFGDQIFHLIGAESINEWKYLLAPSILILCFNQVIGLWAARLKEFKKSVPINTGANFLIRFFNVFYGMATKGAAFGLIFGEIFGKLSGLIIRIYVILRNRLNYIFKLQSAEVLISIAKEYKNYPKYILPASWINLLSFQVPIFLIAKFFDVNTLGYYAIANSLLGLPLRLFGYSLSPVLMQKAVEVGS